MSITRNVGGNRLGSGNKMEVNMKTYNRSNHNLDTIVKTTMAAGTLVPFLSMVGLPGDTFDINLDTRIYTHPTVGPLFGSYKVQLDVFTIPVRLYVPKLHNNTLKAGLKMSDIKLPQLSLVANMLDETDANVDLDNAHINPSCILKYLGISGLGSGSLPGASNPYIARQFNAIPYLGYWDIYKNYYANKQEEIGAVIHNAREATDQTITAMTAELGPDPLGTIPEEPNDTGIDVGQGHGVNIRITYTGTTPDWDQVLIKLDSGAHPIPSIFTNMTVISATETTWEGMTIGGVIINYRYQGADDLVTDEPQVYTFPLENLDTMRNQLLANVMSPTAYVIDDTEIEPYNLPLKYTGTAGTENARYSKLSTMEGLALKTYQSDMFNNWIQTEWFDGVNGISQMTAVDTTGDQFTIDALTLAKDLWVLLNRVALSDGSYKSWIETVFTSGGYWRAETPSYEGGLSKEVVFEEVISNSESGSETGAQPLGTLAGRGVMGKKHKGGKIVIKPDEIVWMMGIISLTPRIDYSQGNTWDVNLRTMDDFHKPQLDGIGYQDLITDGMAYWDTTVDANGLPIYKSAGKQPAWMNYMTNVNRNYGNFAIESNEMFMTLNRRYEYEDGGIKDLTTYIDPVKYNYIFAETKRDAQNFWVQVGADIKVRRVMSAKIIPNL